MKAVSFKPQSMWADWVYTFSLTGVTAWDTELDEIVLGLTPDALMTWDDYGMRKSTYSDVRPYLSFTSTADDGVITLTDPNTVYIQVPAAQLANLGPGGVNIGISHRRLDTGTRASPLSGRLMLHNTVV